MDNSYQEAGRRHLENVKKHTPFVKQWSEEALAIVGRILEERKQTAISKASGQGK